VQAELCPLKSQVSSLVVVPRKAGPATDSIAPSVHNTAHQSGIGCTAGCGVWGQQQCALAWSSLLLHVAQVDALQKEIDETGKAELEAQREKVSGTQKVRGSLEPVFAY